MNKYWYTSYSGCDVQFLKPFCNLEERNNILLSIESCNHIFDNEHNEASYDKEYIGLKTRISDNRTIFETLVSIDIIFYKE